MAQKTSAGFSESEIEEISFSLDIFSYFVEREIITSKINDELFISPIITSVTRFMFPNVKDKQIAMKVNSIPAVLYVYNKLRRQTHYSYPITMCFVMSERVCRSDWDR